MLVSINPTVNNIRMTYTTITRFLKRDISNNGNSIKCCDIDKNEKYHGFPQEKYTEGEMIDLAVKYGCPIIIKTENRWYLKGKGKSIESLKKLIIKNIGNKTYENRFCLLLE
jgi:hypothetical protein